MLRLVGSLLMLALVAATAQGEEAECPDYLNHEVRKLRSKETVNLCAAYSGRPLLIVNTASRCGFTHQFAGLEALYQRYREQGLVVVGVPSDDFKQAAPDEESAARVCFVNYGVTFTMLSLQRVRGPDAHPLFQELARRSGAPSWNFNKYLVARTGEVERFDSSVDPMSSRVQRAVRSRL